jgi:imidazolonepropionase-like amidohydrolase
MLRLLVQCTFVTALIIGWLTVGNTHDIVNSQSMVSAPSKESGSVTLFQNVRIFSGKGSGLSGLSHVLVRGNQIEKISSQPMPTDRRGDTVMIDGAGRTLMPGLIDAHTHIVMESISMPVALLSDVGYLNLLAARAAEGQLLRGFTSIRDMGGPTYSLKRAIDEGLVNGPRIYPSGAMISQTGGHGDFLMPTDIPRQIGGPLSYMERNNASIVADGPEQVLIRAREQLRNGASQLKLMAGGGVSSTYDPLDVAQYTEEEFRAAVSAAENWGTYVAVHAYTPRAIRAAVAAGVKCVEHGQLMDEPTAKLLADKGIWLSLQPFLDDEDPNPTTGESRKKQLQMMNGTETAYRLAKKYKIKLAFGTDTLFDAKLAQRRGRQLAKLIRWFTPAEVLTMATSTNAELLAMSGPRNPYPGKLGVVEEGALADLLLIDGNPLENIKLIEEPEKNFLVIMKDGQVYKNSLR